MNEKSKESFLVELIKLAVKTAVVCGVAGVAYGIFAKWLMNRQLGWVNDLFNKE